ncbi:MAG: hypothetical protein ABI822_34860 [Bryobacteraceae bacterium]
MIRGAAILLLSAAVVFAADGKQVVVDFEDAALLAKDDLASRIEQWEEKGVVFKLARAPQKSKAKGLVMFFPHLGTGRKGILCAMALEPIPVRATFPKPVSSVTVALWGSTGTPALLEAFDAAGAVVDQKKLESIPGRTAPGDPVPIFTMTVSAPRIAYVQFSGPREGEYLVADEVRFTPVEDGSKQ